MDKLMRFLGNVLFAFKRKRVPKKISRILIFKVGALGDVVMTTPLVRSLRKRYPQARIDYLVGSYAKSVLKGNLYLNHVSTFNQEDVFKRDFGSLLRLGKRIRQKRYDVCLVLDKAWQFGMLASRFGSFNIGFDRGGEGFALNRTVLYTNDMHEVDQYLGLGKLLDIHDLSRDYDIFLTKDDKDYAKREFRKADLLSRRVIGIVPGGALNPAVGHDFVRRFDPDGFVEVIKRLKKPVVLLGGRSDSEFNESIIRQSGGTAFNMVADTVQRSVALMGLCEWVICNDSGPMHFAAASGTRVLSLFGPTNPMRKAPLTEGSQSIWKDSDIYEGDYELYGTPPKSKDFMSRIRPSEILEIVR